MAFDHYLEEEDDKPYYSKNTLAYYYEDMARKEKLIKDMAAHIATYDKTLSANLSTIEQQVNERLAAWDQNLEQLPQNVEDLLQEWTVDGTIDTVIQTALIDEKLEPFTVKLADIAISAKDFGMAGDGVTDDSEAFKNLLNYAKNNNVRSIIIPKPISYYKITKHISITGLNNCTITGRSSTIDLTDVPPNASSNNIPKIYFKACTNLKIENLDFVGSNGGVLGDDTALVEIDLNSKRCIVSQCTFRGKNSTEKANHGLSFYAQNGEVSNCFFKDIYEFGLICITYDRNNSAIYIQNNYAENCHSSYEIAYSARNIHFINNVSLNHSHYGIVVWLKYATLTDTVCSIKNIIIKGNELIGGRSGVIVRAGHSSSPISAESIIEDIIIEHNIISECTNAAIEVAEYYGGEINGLRINKNILHSPNHGDIEKVVGVNIYLPEPISMGQAKAGYINISENNIRGSITKNARALFLVFYNNAENVVLRNNVITNFGNNFNNPSIAPIKIIKSKSLILDGNVWINKPPLFATPFAIQENSDYAIAINHDEKLIFGGVFNDGITNTDIIYSTSEELILSSKNKYVSANANLAPVNVVLPKANSVKKGKEYLIRKHDTSVNIVTLKVAEGSSDFLRVKTPLLNNTGDSIRVVSDGVSSWYGF